MRYHVLICDYDGTLAQNGRVADVTVEVLKRLRESGRRLVLATGRELPDLERSFEYLDLFDYVVAENGALLYRPATREEKLLAEPPPAALVQKLRDAGVTPLSVGRVIVATWEPHETTVLRTIHDLGLERQVIFNKGAVMVLPSGITKASGVSAALRTMGLSAHNAVAVGDAENDHHLLALCECGVAVANALPSLREQADWVTGAERGDGVTELIDKLLASDLAELTPRLERRVIPLGRMDGEEWRIPPYGVNLLLAGTSGSGKSTFAAGFLERIAEQSYQYCVIDPEGDYENLGPVVFGRPDQPPALESVIRLLEDPEENVVVNLLGVPLADRPKFFHRLFSALLGLRARTGRPHWIIVDEVHHMLPQTDTSAESQLAAGPSGLMWITVHPDHVARAALERVDIAVAIGATPRETLQCVGDTVGRRVPDFNDAPLAPGEAVGWEWRTVAPPRRFNSIPPHTERRRHNRKYAKGELPPELSFYFRGPQGKLNLRAQNLLLFLQSAEGVDDDTWLFHLKRGDYSRWFEEVIKDEELADAVREIEHTPQVSPRRTRLMVRRQIEKRYSAPA
jgi:HAD superfamily hydrolase (TIGR01484 family)